MTVQQLLVVGKRPKSSNKTISIKILLVSDSLLSADIYCKSLFTKIKDRDKKLWRHKAVCHLWTLAPDDK